MGTHNELLQPNPAITEKEPEVTGNPQPTCDAADGNRGTSIGVDFEDGIWSYGKHRSVDTGYCR